MEPYLFGVNYYEWFMFALATPVQFWVGARFYVAAWKSIKVTLCFVILDFLFLIPFPPLERLPGYERARGLGH